MEVHRAFLLRTRPRPNPGASWRSRASRRPSLHRGASEPSWRPDARPPVAAPPRKPTPAAHRHVLKRSLALHSLSLPAPAEHSELGATACNPICAHEHIRICAAACVATLSELPCLQAGFESDGWNNVYKTSLSCTDR